VLLLSFELAIILLVTLLLFILILILKNVRISNGY
jgi:hypothetical protein